MAFESKARVSGATSSSLPISRPEIGGSANANAGTDTGRHTGSSAMSGHTRRAPQQSDQQGQGHLAHTLLLVQQATPGVPQESAGSPTESRTFSGASRRVCTLSGGRPVVPSSVNQ